MIIRALLLRSVYLMTYFPKVIYVFVLLEIYYRESLFIYFFFRLHNCFMQTKLKSVTADDKAVFFRLKWPPKEQFFYLMALVHTYLK